MKNKKNNQGSSIIEVIIALSLIAIVILSLVRVTISSLNNASYAKDQRAATQYAQEALEKARNCKEEEEALFWTFACPELPELEGFTRTITYTLDPGDANIMIVTATVTWEDGRGEHRSELVTHLTKK